MKLSKLPLRHGRILGYSLKSAIDPNAPQWLQTGDLGTYDIDTYNNIIPQYSNPADDILSFRLSGSLPPGYLFNTNDGSISGQTTDSQLSTTTTYKFSITIVTSDSKNTTGNFSITINTQLNTVVWQTPSDLGTYNMGTSINANLVATEVSK